MCNLYNVTTTHEAIIAWVRAMRDVAGNMPPAFEVYPDSMGPVVRNAPDGVRELARLRWGMPTPPKFLTGKADRGVTNIRNPTSPHWRAWLKVEHRCVVLANCFAEPDPARKVEGERTPDTWFALNDDRPLFAFAGIWTRWRGVRKVKDGPGEFDLYGFLTTEPNSVVAPVHQKAMPVILTTEAEVETWLTAPAEEALKLQRPLPDAALKVVPAPPNAGEVTMPAPPPVPPQGSLL